MQHGDVTGRELRTAQNRGEVLDGAVQGHAGLLHVEPADETRLEFGAAIQPKNDFIIIREWTDRTTGELLLPATTL